MHLQLCPSFTLWQDVLLASAKGYGLACPDQIIQRKRLVQYWLDLLSDSPNWRTAVQRGSSRARPKTPKHGDTGPTPATGFKQAYQPLFALFSSARSSGSAARCGAATGAYRNTCLSFFRTSCSRIAAALAAQFSSKSAGAGSAASSAAFAAKPDLVSDTDTGKSAKHGSPSLKPVPHRSTKDDTTSESPDELLIRQAKELFALGVQALDQDDFVRALDLFNDGLKLNITDNKLSSSLHNNKGFALMELKRYAPAVVECCKAIDLNKDAWHPHFVKHLAWRHIGLYTQAAEDLMLAQQKGGRCKQCLCDVATADSVQYGTLLGLGNYGRPLGKRDVQTAYREMMRECHPDKAPDDQKHEHRRHVAHMLAQYLNFARDKLIASL